MLLRSASVSALTLFLVALQKLEWRAEVRAQICGALLRSLMQQTTGAGVAAPPGAGTTSLDEQSGRGASSSTTSTTNGMGTKRLLGAATSKQLRLLALVLEKHYLGGGVRSSARTSCARTTADENLGGRDESSREPLRWTSAPEQGEERPQEPSYGADGTECWRARVVCRRLVRAIGRELEEREQTRRRKAYY